MYLKTQNLKINIKIEIIKRLTHTTINYILHKESTLMVYSKYPIRTHLSNFPSYSCDSSVNSYRLSMDIQSLFYATYRMVFLDIE